MSGLNSYKSWKDLTKPPNPFFGAMFSKSHRKKKRKRVLQPIDNPRERGRSLESSKQLDPGHGIRSISEENSTILKLKHENLKNLILNPESIPTESSLELKKTSTLNQTIEKISDFSIQSSKSREFSQENGNSLKYAEIDKAIGNNSINMRKKYLKPAHPDNPKPSNNYRRSRKFVKSPTKNDSLPYAPDLKPVGFNSFQVGLFAIENEYSVFYNSLSNEGARFEKLLKSVNCKFFVNLSN